MEIPIFLPETGDRIDVCVLRLDLDGLPPLVCVGDFQWAPSVAHAAFDTALDVLRSLDFGPQLEEATLLIAGDMYGERRDREDNCNGCDGVPDYAHYTQAFGNRHVAIYGNHDIADAALHANYNVLDYEVCEVSPSNLVLGVGGIFSERSNPDYHSRINRLLQRHKPRILLTHDRAMFYGQLPNLHVYGHVHDEVYLAREGFHRINCDSRVVLVL